MRFDSHGWLDDAIEIDYLNKSESREGYTPKYLIIHGTAGGTSAQEIANYFATGSEQASAHLIIGTDGTICQGIPLSLAAWANGPIDGTPADNLGFRTESDGVHRDSWWNDNLNPNFITVSIEHCKASTDNSDSLTPAQQDTSFKLIACICDTYGIPKRFADSQGGITGHFSMSAINRQHCPGPYPWQELFAYLNSGQQEETPMAIDISNPVVASYFKASADGKTWQCKNGYVIGGAILDFYKSFGNSALCGLSHLGLPLTLELPTGKQGTVFQRFERGVLAYDPARKNDNPPGLDPAVQVYTAHIDSGIGEDPRVTDLTAQIQALQPASQQAEITALESKISQAVKDLS